VKWIPDNLRGVRRRRGVASQLTGLKASLALPPDFLGSKSTDQLKCSECSMGSQENPGWRQSGFEEGAS